MTAGLPSPEELFSENCYELLFTLFACSVSPLQNGPSNDVTTIGSLDLGMVKQETENQMYFSVFE
jgi:hypothetical protein